MKDYNFSNSYQVVPSGRYLNGKSLDFVIAHNLNHRSHKDVLVFIRPPSGYKSPLLKHFRERTWESLLPEPTFGFIQISFKSYENVKDIVPRSFTDDDKFVYIERFYMFNNLNPELTSNEEKTALKGMGALMLCLGIGYCVEKGYIDMDHREDVYVLLEAQSSKCIHDPKFDAYSEDDIILELYHNHLLDLHLHIKEEAYYNKYWKTPEEKLQDLKHLLCKITANKTLIEYYKKRYNFKVMYEKKGYDTYMYAKLDDLIKKCNPLKLVN